MNETKLETLGTLELRIARLQSMLQVLKSQIKMSRAYPERQHTLRKSAVKVRNQLKRLTKLRQSLQLQQVSQTS